MYFKFFLTKDEANICKIISFRGIKFSTIQTGKKTCNSCIDHINGSYHKVNGHKICRQGQIDPDIASSNIERFKCFFQRILLLKLWWLDVVSNICSPGHGMYIHCLTMWIGKDLHKHNVPTFQNTKISGMYTSPSFLSLHLPVKQEMVLSTPLFSLSPLFGGNYLSAFLV